jgi:hypothetical protein
MRNAKFGVRKLDLFTAEHAEVSEKFFKKPLGALILYSQFSAVKDENSAFRTPHSEFIGPTGIPQLTFLCLPNLCKFQVFS